MDQGLMLYDADCGFCTRCAHLTPRLGVRVEIASLQGVDLARSGIEAERAVREMPFVHPDGRVDYGHRAWAAILRTGPWPWRLVGRLLGSRLMAGPAAAGYRWVSEHRSRLPGGTAACALDQR